MIGSDLEGADPVSRVERTEGIGRSRTTCAGSCRSSQEGAAPATSGSVTRIQARSASACRGLARRGAGGQADLPARAGAVQVDAGVAGAVRAPALGVPDAAGGHGMPPTDALRGT